MLSVTVFCSLLGMAQDAAPIARLSRGAAPFWAAYLTGQALDAFAHGDAARLARPSFWAGDAAFGATAWGVGRMLGSGASPARFALPLAAATGAAQIVSGNLSPRDFLLSTGSTFTAAAAVQFTADRFAYPMLFSAGPPGWVAAGAYTVGKIALSVYLGERLEAWLGGLFADQPASYRNYAAADAIGIKPRLDNLFGADGRLDDLPAEFKKLKVPEPPPPPPPLDQQMLGKDSLVSRADLARWNTPENVVQLAKVISSEGDYTYAKDAERRGIAYTVLNRMKRNGKNSVSGVWHAYAYYRRGFDEDREFARRVLAGEVEDPTGGATHFYSPIAMRPRGRVPWFGRNFPRVMIDGARDWWYRFHRQPGSDKVY